MNIIIRNYGCGTFCCRPDTTWERENKDFFSPDFIQDLQGTTVAFARIGKAGKCIGKKFVSRYYDAFNFGVLLYDGGMLAKGGTFAGAQASLLDHSSVLPFPLYPATVLDGEPEAFALKADGKEIFVQEVDATLKEMLESAICEASAFISLRIGDMVAVELGGPETWAAGDKMDVLMEGNFCGNEIFRFKILK